MSGHDAGCSETGDTAGQEENVESSSVCEAQSSEEASEEDMDDEDIDDGPSEISQSV